MMKSIILIALPVCLVAAAAQSAPPITVGVAQPGDQLLSRAERFAPAIPNAVGTMTAQHFLNEVIKINFITFTELGPPQGAIVSFVGGLGTNNITYILTSAKGRGFMFVVDLWGNEAREGAGFMSHTDHKICTMTVYDGENVQTSDCK